MNIPIDFIEQTRTLLGDAECDKLINALAENSPVSLRLNSSKWKNCQQEIPDTLTDRVPWCDTGFYLDERLTFTFDPLFHAGAYYVQEASSMFLEQAVKAYFSQPATVLDLCAAPGGKSTHLRSCLPGGSLLVANEVIRSRSQILAENITKWGHTDVVVTNNDPADFSSLYSFFDAIVADVPCSGEGMFRKDPESMKEWSLANVEICRQRQRRIIADVWPSLKPGGLLLYSTCTYNTKENEENVAWISEELGAEILPIQTSGFPEITGNLLGEDFPVYRFLPHKTKGEGFFLAVLRKHEDASVREANLKKHKNSKFDFKEQWLKDSNRFQLLLNGQTVSALREEYVGKAALLQQELRIVQRGVALGEIKGKDVVPAHALAMSNEYASGSFFVWEISYEDAIAYLRKEAIVLDDEVPKGYILLTYRQLPLGFVKNIGNRANNLYPQEWRIRTGFMPESIKCL
ncbi:methyltransferase RsmF C-terminal domain-like protein [Bacteroides sp. 224]|uniref:methyltransferase RsmF C-terminal domain-like protein n=1 Tax=Bacteroides sp. 224 TaxID=2302936 RepID=UPI0013D07CD1|nr:rRNA cytosine-C5-methyltransferase [Bacteroides sp. 224]NDV65629.1 rRNA cytosine-C5-methyltransferase [Bacteroides sp. 224]